MFATLLMTVALAGDPGIHRCRATDGSLVYQDRPCATGTAQARRSPDVSRAARSTPIGQYGAPDERALAACSERFLHCSGSDAARMDSCIAAIAPCSSGRTSSCCPATCVERYRSQRRSGESLASAVRLALLDPDLPSCAASTGR